MINIAELLKDAPKGMKLYSPLFGEVFLYTILSDSKFITVRTADSITTFNEFGQWGDNSRLERFPDAECLLFPSKDCRTWEGWKVPAKPNFKVEDWICPINGKKSKQVRVIEVRSLSYFTEDKFGILRPICFSAQDEWRLWTIADAKDGDVLAADECYVIFKEIDGLNIKCYCTYHYMGFNPSFHIDTLQNKTAFHPATKEQRDLLFAKIKEAGYEWVEKEKELRKIKPHYDILNFHAGMPVLVRADNNCRWDYSVFSRITGNEDWPFAVCNGVSFTQCIPFEGNEHLLGATDMPNEMYINW